jgi:enamine deaminase RidA (YjgF/YER057c/UK114 family)
MPVSSVHVPGLHHGKAPIPVAAVVGPLLTSSRIFGLDPETGRVPSDPGEQVRLVFTNIERVLAAAGGTVHDIAKIGVYLADDASRPVVDECWAALYPDPDRRPARHIELTSSLRAPLAVQADLVAYLTATAAGAPS